MDVEMRRGRVTEGICGVGKVEDTLRLAADTGPDGISTVSVRKVAARLIPLCMNCQSSAHWLTGC